MHFDAHVTGLPDYCNLVRAQLGRDEARYQVSKMRAARDEVVRILGAKSRKQVTELFRRQHAPVSHLYCEKVCMLRPLREWISQHTAHFSARTMMPESSHAAHVTTRSDSALKSNTSTSSAVLQAVTRASVTSSASSPVIATTRAPFRALDALGLNDALIIPLELPKPLLLDLKGRTYRLPVVSAQVLLEEIEDLDNELETARTFGVPRVPPFMCARAADIERLARLEGLNDRFWVRFSAVVLKQLAQTALASGLCAHITDRPLLPCVD